MLDWWANMGWWWLMWVGLDEIFFRSSQCLESSWWYYAITVKLPNWGVKCLSLRTHSRANGPKNQSTWKMKESSCWGKRPIFGGTFATSFNDVLGMRKCVLLSPDSTKIPKKRNMFHTHLGGGFKYFLIFTPDLGGDDPIWLYNIFQVGWLKPPTSHGCSPKNAYHLLCFSGLYHGHHWHRRRVTVR